MRYDIATQTSWVESHALQDIVTINAPVTVVQRRYLREDGSLGRFEATTVVPMPVVDPEHYCAGCLGAVDWQVCYSLPPCLNRYKVVRDGTTNHTVRCIFIEDTSEAVAEYVTRMFKQHTQGGAA